MNVEQKKYQFVYYQEEMTEKILDQPVQNPLVQSGSYRDLPVILLLLKTENDQKKLKRGNQTGRDDPGEDSSDHS
jgi:hypothetical protein